MLVSDFDKLTNKGKKNNAPLAVIKTCGHCYDGGGWNTCDFWWIDKKKRSRCSMFGNAVKYTSESLVICNKIYGRDYEGEA